MNSEMLPKTWQNIMNTSGFMPVVVKSIESFRDANWSKESSTHKYYEMVYVKKGTGEYIVENKRFTVGPNDIVIVKPNKKHCLKVKSEKRCEFTVIYFSFVSRFNDVESHKTKRIYSDIPLDDFINFVSGERSDDYLNLKVNQKNDIIILLEQLVCEKTGQEIGSECMVQLLIMQLFVMISRALKMEWENSIKAKTTKIKELIDISVKYIENNYERDTTLNDVAKYVFLSQSYFARMFKKEKGISPINYLLKVRIERAKELLLSSEMKASEIAAAVGFSNQQRFNEIFKKYTQLTPIQYRKHGSLLIDEKY